MQNTDYPSSFLWYQPLLPMQNVTEYTTPVLSSCRLILPTRMSLFCESPDSCKCFVCWEWIVNEVIYVPWGTLLCVTRKNSSRATSSVSSSCSPVRISLRGNSLEKWCAIFFSIFQSFFFRFFFRLFDFYLIIRFIAIFRFFAIFLRFFINAYEIYSSELPLVYRLVVLFILLSILFDKLYLGSTIFIGCGQWWIIGYFKYVSGYFRS